MTLTFHTDAGHGWLFATHAELRMLGLNTSSFTPYSFRDSTGVYAEEDIDAGTIIRAHNTRFGCDPVFVFRDHGMDAPCRSLERCTGDADVTC
jgi:hypothetical protein